MLGKPQINLHHTKVQKSNFCKEGQHEQIFLKDQEKKDLLWHKTPPGRFGGGQSHISNG